MAIFKRTTIISVYVTRELTIHSGTHWALFADYPDQYEAFEAIQRALSDTAEGYLSAELRTRTVFNA